MHYVVKEFKFDAAHRLFEYDGDCENIHGHTYKVKLMLSSKEVDKMGMVVDFKKIKKQWKKIIDKNFDHSLILNIRDKKLVSFCQEEGYKIWIMSDNPTAENMAKLFFDLLNPTIKNLCEVTVYETPTSKAIYSNV